MCEQRGGSGQAYKVTSCSNCAFQRFSVLRIVYKNCAQFNKNIERLDVVRRERMILNIIVGFYFYGQPNVVSKTG